MNRLDTDVNLVFLRKDVDRYLFIFRAEEVGKLSRIARRFARDPELSFTERDRRTVVRKACELAG